MAELLRGSIRRALVIALVVTALGAGYFVRGLGGHATARPPAPAPAAVKTRKFSAADLLLAASTAQGIHMRIPGITTGALNAAHSNDIPLDSFQFGVGRGIGPAASGHAASKPSVSEVTVTHQLDNFSIPLLNQALRGGNNMVIIYFTDLSGPGATPFDYLEADLGTTLVSGYSMSSGGDKPSESVSLNFTTMTFKFKVSGSATVQTVSYNLTTQS
jgi:type VI secretion system secreted protein Hcp